MEANRIAPFKLLILGDQGVGKTTFLERHVRAQLRKKLDPCVFPLHFDTGNSTMSFCCWDTAGQERYYIRATFAIIMFDVTSPLTFSHVAQWHRDLCRVCPDITYVICGNKADMRAPGAPVYTFRSGLRGRLLNAFYCEISASTGYNIEIPFQHLLHQLYGFRIRFVVPVVADPPEIDLAANQDDEESD